MQLWLEQRIPHFTCGSGQCIAIQVDDVILAIFCFMNYKHTDVELALASDSPRWAHKRTIKTVLSYAFDTLKVQRISALVDKHNKRIRKFLAGMHFVEEGKLRHAAPNNKDMFIYGLTKRDFRTNYG